jgi:hypothetical protein
MSDPISESFGIVFGIIGLALVVAAYAFLGSIILVVALMFAVAAVPFFAVKMWRENPVRLEREAGELNQLLYQKVLEGSLEAISLNDTYNILAKELPAHFSVEARVHLTVTAAKTLLMADLLQDVPKPPPIANSVEGGRYKDRLERMSVASPTAVREVLELFAKILGMVGTIAPEDGTSSAEVPAKYFVRDVGELVQDIIELIFSNPLLSTLQQKLDANLEAEKQVMPKDSNSADIVRAYFKGTPLVNLLSFSLPRYLPYDLRTEHHSVIAGSGRGKTTLFKSMIVDDLEEDVCIIVIDSQRAVINQLAERIDPDRLILIDPSTCPPALNLFAVPVDGEGSIGRALQMFSYIFESRGVDFSSQQALLYRNLSRLCMVVPGASLVTMREMCKPMATATPEYQQYIEKLDANSCSFFAEYNLPKNGRYDETRQGVLSRLQIALESPTFERMLGAKTMKLDILKEIEAGKVILINTDKHLLQDTGAALFGRIFAGLIMQAVRSRPELTGKRVYLYIDEFADYASDAPLMIDLFKQGRKYNLGMIVAFQVLSDLTPKLASDMSASTSIRMANGVSPSDRTAVARLLETSEEMILMQPKGTFAAYLRDVGTMPWKVIDGRLEATPPHPEHVMENLRERMRRDYGEQPEVLTPLTDAPKVGEVPTGDDFKDIY